MWSSEKVNFVNYSLLLWMKRFSETFILSVQECFPLGAILNCTVGSNFDITIENYACDKVKGRLEP